MPSVFARPAIGSIFERQNLNGLSEESAIVCVQYNPQAVETAWQGVLVTKNGFEFVSGQAEHRNIHDWRPKGWVTDGLGGWADPSSVPAVAPVATPAVIVQHKDGKPVKKVAPAAPPVLEEMGEPSVGDMLTAATPKLPSVSIPRV